MCEKDVYWLYIQEYFDALSLPIYICVCVFM